MNDILKSIIIFGTVFLIVLFGGLTLNLSPLLLFLGASLIVFLVIGYQAFNAIKTKVR
ncbi:hypothetical protein CAR_c00960 [Carnobacterium sp. 17-4]|uniref:hypothetical protein n=1 Tax=Carnobacterium sp. (strain 17-4) TaxID=208596 RepID=UPI00020588DE|nr:hypothetical protein [Carnobacterium sp. 17-4]AEB28847.1 hypothetical protein CAR_c00960 [Carnobacterium sp. 17-4]